jgi:hypothetical protein
MYTAEQSWEMTEPEKVVALIKEVQCWRLGNWDGCCCSSFSIRNVHIDISCGKGREQAVWIHSNSLDYPKGEDALLLTPVMDEVVRQLNEQSGRGDAFARYFHAWSRS